MSPNKKRINALQEQALTKYADRRGSNWKLHLRADWKAGVISGFHTEDDQKILLGLKDAGHFGTRGLDHWSPR